MVKSIKDEEGWTWWNLLKSIKDEEGKVLVTEQNIKELWNFHKIFNEVYKTLLQLDRLNTTEEGQNYFFYHRIWESKAKETLKRIDNSKAVGPNNIPIELWKCLEGKDISWLTKLVNEIMRSNKMLDEWRRSILIPIYKHKGDIQNCTNYRGIKLMGYAMKLWERVIE